jgi:hypothetical protein
VFSWLIDEYETGAELDDCASEGACAAKADASTNAGRSLVLLMRRLFILLWDA